ncbi:MAG: hypothetical protein QG646_3008, partial [Euryarchaeota archaeon]|nr:hypothetical protein [Euryarchaeota archaeon]
MKKAKLFIFLILTILAAGLVYGLYEYREFTAVPTGRLAAGSYYPEMPPDSHHYYLQLPIEHNNPELSNFTGFYILSPNFKPGGEVI